MRLTGLDQSDKAEFTEFLSTAHRLADAAGAIILQNFRRPLDIENKEDDAAFDPVTIADQDGERIIREHLARAWPDHGVSGEEFGKAEGTSGYQWIIDPIDGTRAFIMGHTAWGILIGLTKDGQPVLGLMDQPYTKERFWRGAEGSYGRGPFGEEVLNARDCSGLKSAFLATTSPDFLAEGEETDRFMALKAKVRQTRFGGDCYSYCLLAAGHIDVVVEAGLKAHDIMPLIPIIEGAGGIVTDWTGGSAVQGGRVIAAGSRAVHEEALGILSK